MRTAIDTVTRLLLWKKRSQRLSPPGEIVKVNVGSGLVVAPGWINVEGSLHAWSGRLPTPLLRFAHRVSGSSGGLQFSDYQRIVREHTFVPHDLRFGIPLDDETADFIYIARVLETLYLDETEALFREARRTLKPGGYIRVLVNDLQALMARYRTGDRKAVIKRMYGGPDSTLLNSCRSVYDYDLLRDILMESGFEDITRKEFRVGKVPDLEMIEHRPEEAAFVEAIRT